MKTTTLQNCAASFWGAYEQFLAHPDTLSYFVSDTERLRFLNSIAFTAIDAQVNSYWRLRIVPEWQEFLSLIQFTCEDDEALLNLKYLSDPYLSRAQIKASLRFIEHTGEPEKFSPTFCDMGISLLLMTDSHQLPKSHHDAAHILFQIQKIRNCALHTGRDFNEVSGNKALLLINQWIEASRHVHPIFHFELKQYKHVIAA